MGLLRTAAKAAVASSVHGRVQRRQQQRWAGQERHAPPAPAAPPPPPPAPEASGDMREKLDLLAQLGQLKEAGVLTDEEFEAKKASIMAG
jgi:Short C-terminal domain